MQHLEQSDQFEPYGRLDRRLVEWFSGHSLQFMRLSLGFVFLAFGLLKFIPDASPAESLSIRTVDTLTFGVISGDVARILVAAAECLVGLSLLTGRLLKAGVVLLGFVMIGVMAPLVLFTGELFSGPYHAPTLEAQYVVKDIVLLTAGFNVALRTRGAHMVVEEVGADQHRG